jgi:pilus assembly protein CpaC
MKTTTTNRTTKTTLAKLARITAATGAALAALLVNANVARGQATTRPVQPTTAPTPAPAISTTQPAETGRIRLMVNKSTVLVTQAPFSRVSVGEPEVADVTPIGPTNLLITAKRPGGTQIIVWDDNDQTQTIDIVVEFDLEALREQLKKTFPSYPITADSANGSVVLAGTVPTLKVAEQAALIAGPYAPKVINTLEIAGGQQVSLQVKFAEVSRTATNTLGVNFGFTDGVGIGASNIGGVAPFSLVEGVAPGSQGLGFPPGGAGVTLFGAGEMGSTRFNFFINALRQNSLLRVLAEPNLIAMSGQEASFLAGGEFPIPVPQEGGGGSGSTITIVYKEYGVRLRFIPVVLGDGSIRLKCEPEVSDLDYSNAVSVGGFPVPGLRTRRVSTTVELADGQSFALAGLLNDTSFTRKDVTPLLGDIPILGALFRSSRFERRETELVVLVTPRIVAPMNPGEIPALPGEKWRRPNELQLYFQGDLGGEQTPDASAQPSTPPLFIGEYGFTPAPATVPVSSATTTDSTTVPDTATE